MTTRIVCLADLHTGSRVGLADPSFGAASAQDAGFPVREKLFTKWKEAIKLFGKPDILIVNGDAIEGQNSKQSGIGLWSTDILEQVHHAERLLRMWRAGMIWIVRGSNYHVGARDSALYAEEILARQLGAEIWPGQQSVPEEFRDRSGWMLYLTHEGVTFDIKHPIGTTRFFHYMATPTAREMLQAKLNDMLRHEMGGAKTARIIIRAHAHYYNSVGYSGSDGFVLPCWKGLDEYALKASNTFLSPDLGLLRFTVNGDKYGVEKWLFRITDIQPAPHVIIK